MHPQPSRPSARAGPVSGTEPAPQLFMSVAIGTQIEYHRPHEHATPIPSIPAARRRPGRAVGWPTAPPPPTRHPGIPAEPALSLSEEPALSRGTQQQPTPQAHRRTPSIRAPQPTVSSPPNPPIPPGPNRPLNRPELAQIRTPRALKSFLEKTLTRAQHPVSSAVQQPSSTRPSVIPASSAGTQRQPASQGLRATPSIPRPQPHRLVRPAQLTDHPSVPPDAEDSPIRRKKPPQAISGQPVPSGDRLARDSSPLLPQAAAGAHRRPTVTLTPRSPKAREGFAHGRRNHRSRG